LICGGCGYDNPREHRYCGMCGTPFPHRPLTVPDAQSTLTFTATPLAVLPSPLPVSTVEPEMPPATEAVEPPPATLGEVTEPAPDVAEPPAAVVPEITTAIASVAPEVILPELAPMMVEEGSVLEPIAQPPGEPETSMEPPEPLVTQSLEEPLPVVEEPVLEAPYAGETTPAESLVEPISFEPSVPPSVTELPPPVEIPPPAPEPSWEEVPGPEISRPSPPKPYIAARPVAPLPQAPLAHDSAAPSRPAAIHPSPDSLPITPPPESAGMPTFQSVVDAAGPSPISPFEPPPEKEVDEDEELKEFVANFFYKPPEETVDELTMRSEVPVIDEEEPAQFHHPSFDDDVAPPPEAHTIDDAYVSPDGDAGSRPRFLDIAEHPPAEGADQPAPAANTPSFLHLDDPAPVPATLEKAPPSGRHWLMWSSLAALLLIFGALGFFEGRAELTHESRGPFEVVREQYGKLRQLISQWTATTSAPAAAPSDETTKPDQQSPAKSEPSTTNQSPASNNPQPNPSRPTASSAPATVPAVPEPQVQGQTPPSQPGPGQQSSTPGGTGSATNATEVAKNEPPKPLDAPPPKPATKPQPGQAELAKALDASDSAAAAAWLWKSTSRGNPEAPVRLADMYIKGKGVPRSCEQALVLLRSAAVKPNAPARNRLAALYANGTCVARDRVRAYEFLSSALEADPTSEWADQSRKELWNQMTAAERAQVQKPN